MASQQTNDLQASRPPIGLEHIRTMTGSARGHALPGPVRSLARARAWISYWGPSGSVTVMRAFQSAQPRVLAQASSGSPTASRKLCRSSPSRNVQAMTRSHAGSPTQQAPKSITAESRPSVVSRLSVPMSPWNHTGSAFHAVRSASCQMDVHARASTVFPSSASACWTWSP